MAVGNPDRREIARISQRLGRERDHVGGPRSQRRRRRAGIQRRERGLGQRHRQPLLEQRVIGDDQTRLVVDAVEQVVRAGLVHHQIGQRLRPLAAEEDVENDILHAGAAQRLGLGDAHGELRSPRALGACLQDRDLFAVVVEQRRRRLLAAPRLDPGDDDLHNPIGEGGSSLWHRVAAGRPEDRGKLAEAADRRRQQRPAIRDTDEAENAGGARQHRRRLELRRDLDARYNKC